VRRVGWLVGEGGRVRGCDSLGFLRLIVFFVRGDSWCDGWVDGWMDGGVIIVIVVSE